MQITQQDNRWVVRGDLLIANVNTLLEASKAFQLGQNTVIDLAGVENIDTAAISLLLEWQRRASAEKQTIHCVNMPQNLAKLAQLYGVSEMLS